MPFGGRERKSRLREYSSKAPCGFTENEILLRGHFGVDVQWNIEQLWTTFDDMDLAEHQHVT